MAAQLINKSVGRGGVNAPADVEKVQTLLKSKKVYEGRVDKICGPKTITAIEKFQTHFMRSPDGRVDANGTTWKKLTGMLPMGAALPAQSATAATTATIQVAGLDWPLDINSMKRGTMGTFGMVRNQGTRPHHGWDIFATVGTPIYAVADGTVHSICTTRYDGNPTKYGMYIILRLSLPDFGNDIFAFYGHLDQVGVSSIQSVRCGQQIGRAGCSGNAFGMTGNDQHLHFEFRKTPLPVGGQQGLALRYDPKDLYGILPNNMNIQRVGA